jgi:hypothetical protein
MPTHTLTHSHTHAVVLIIALIIFTLIILTGLGILWVLCWIAKGEPDINGDPERDAGSGDPSPNRSPASSSIIIPDHKFFVEHGTATIREDAVNQMRAFIARN